VGCAQVRGWRDAHAGLPLLNHGWVAAAGAADNRIEPAALASLPRERRAAHLVDVAHGLAITGQRDKAVSTLLAAERLAAQEVHCRTYAREVITGLARTSVPVPSRELRGLAERAGAEL
jgi:hypothetical protein